MLDQPSDNFSYDNEEEIGGEEMSFLDHLEELRWHLVRAVVSILVFTIIAFVFKDFFFGQIVLGPSRIDFFTYQFLCKMADRLNSPVLCIEELDFILQSRKLTGQFMMHLTSSIVIGIVIAFPYVFWEIWRFIKPGLYSKEQKLTRGAVFFVSLLFLCGISFGYFIISPLSINFLAGYELDQSITNQFDIASYVGVVSMLVLSCGLMFQLPMVIFVLTRAGLVNPTFLRKYRRHALVVILVISAILTPPDVMSQILISFPLLFLYEVSIVISGMEVKRREKKEAKENNKLQKK